jgi:hypothetical protein
MVDVSFVCLQSPCDHDPSTDTDIKSTQMMYGSVLTPQIRDISVQCIARLFHLAQFLLYCSLLVLWNRFDLLYCFKLEFFVSRLIKLLLDFEMVLIRYKVGMILVVTTWIWIDLYVVYFTGSHYMFMVAVTAIQCSSRSRTVSGK